MLVDSVLNKSNRFVTFFILYYHQRKLILMFGWLKHRGFNKKKSLGYPQQFRSMHYKLGRNVIKKNNNRVILWLGSL